MQSPALSVLKASARLARAAVHNPDCHLEYARLHLACGKREKARQSLTKAKEMIEDMGYHRRDAAVAELDRVLSQSG